MFALSKPTKYLKFSLFFTNLYYSMRIFNTNLTVLLLLQTNKNWRRYSTNTKNQPKPTKFDSRPYKSKGVSASSSDMIYSNI
jgi:hypothetical protein